MQEGLSNKEDKIFPMKKIYSIKIFSALKKNILTKKAFHEKDFPSKQKGSPLWIFYYI